MKTLKILSIDFANPVHDYEIPAYRAAIAHKIGEGNLLFHHHLDENHLLRRYPLIQYKRKNQNLSIIFFEEATEFIYKFLNEEEWKIRVGQEEKILRIQKINIYQSNMSFSKEKIDYKISNWLALNEQNYKTYKNLKSLSEKVAMLERILIAHIIAFAEGIQWTIDRPIELNIIDIHKEKWSKYKKVALLAFDVSFCTNILLPDGIGLGKATSVGYGNIQKKISKYFAK